MSLNEALEAPAVRVVLFASFVLLVGLGVALYVLQPWGVQSTSGRIDSVDHVENGLELCVAPDDDKGTRVCALAGNSALERASIEQSEVEVGACVAIRYARRNISRISVIPCTDH